MSVAKENFIKTVYQLQQKEAKGTRPGIIAEKLGISNAAATDMARKLSDRNYVLYKKYQGLKLTEKGNRLALEVIRKHRLWETFLYQTLGISLHEIHREAELLEHQTSSFLADQIDVFLGHPEFDPHGDPIPDASGNISANKEEIQLTKAQANREYLISRLVSSEKEFFDFCNSNNIIPGQVVLISKQYPKNKMTEIVINKTKLLINDIFSSIIYVKPNL